MKMDLQTDKKLPVSEREVNHQLQLLREPYPISREGAYAAVSYVITAVLLVMFNKAALSTYGFPYANVITLFQMICSCAFLFALKSWKIISFRTDEPPSMDTNPPALVPCRTLVQTLPLALSFLLYMLVSMESIRKINVPMYTTLRRTTPAFTMIVEYLLTGRKYSLSIVGSVGIIVTGAFIAGARDLSFNTYGYAVVFIANVCSAVYLASICRIGKSSGLNSFGLMWCNGITCGPVLLIWILIKGDLLAMMDFPYILFPGFQVVVLLSCILAFLINYFVFLSTTLNSALTQTICGNVKDLFTIGIGWLLFAGIPFDPLNIVGHFVGFFGSCLYAYYKLQGE